MIPNSLRPLARGFLIVTAAALIPVTAGCEAGTNAPTQRWHQPTPGASAVIDNTIRVSNMFVLGAAPGATLPAGGSAGVFLAVADTGAPDRLLSVSAPGSAASVQLPGGGISIGRQQVVQLTGPAPKVVLQHLTRPLQGGQAIRMVLNFANAGSVPLAVPVMPRANYFVTYSPAPASPTPSATSTSKHHKKPQTTPSPSSTPAPSPTG